LEEAEAATNWYRQRSVRAAELFLDELDRAVAQLQTDANRFPEYLFGTRRLLLRRFSYLVIFRLTTTAIEVIAIAHGRRRPGYWRERVD
jgi:plasmid stabilization system protein ParE